MRYIVETFRPDGIFLGAVGFDADSRDEAVEHYRDMHERLPLFHERIDPTTRYIHIHEQPELPADGSCPRCGGSRGACGGPTDPHE